MTGRSQKLVLGGMVCFALLILSLPIVIVVAASVTSGNIIAFPPEGFSLKWYQKILEARDLRQAFGRSLLVAVICVLVSVPVGTLAGIALSRYRLRFATGLPTWPISTSASRSG